ncbi:unnamed protein product, partial [Heterotrigona itama]
DEEWKDTSERTIIRASAIGGEIILKSMHGILHVGHERSRRDSADCKRLCPLAVGCAVKHAIVTDPTMACLSLSFSNLAHGTLKTVDSLLIEDFGKYDNLTVESRVKMNCLFTP